MNLLENTIIKDLDLIAADEKFYELRLIDGYYMKPSTYYISNYCRVYSKIKGRILAGMLTRDGYIRHRLVLDNKRSRSFKEHRIMMNVFNPIDNPHKFPVSRLNDIKTDNKLSNLYWSELENSGSYTYKQKVTHTNHLNSNKLSEDQVRKICDVLVNDSKTPFKTIAKQFDLHSTSIYDIYSRTTWSSVSKEYVFASRKSKTKYTPEDIHTICKYLKEVSTFRSDYPKLAELLGVECDITFIRFVSRIRWGSTHTDISKGYKILGIR